VGKLFLLALVVLGAGLYFPETRARLIDRLDPIIQPALAPIRAGSTREELRQIAQDLQGHERLYDRLPANAELFRQWLYNQYVAPSNYQDSWGSEFGFAIFPDSFSVVSAGPDRSFNTGDDLRVTRPRARKGRRR
jgi:hypothetical protein